MSPTRFCTGWFIVLCLASSLTSAEGDRLVSRPRPVTPAEKQLKVGTRLATGPGESRRLVLPDRSLLYVRERTTVRLPAEGTLELSSGEVFIESAPGKLAPSLVVQTPRGKLRARDSRFGVRTGAAGTSVVVATGSVKVDGVETPVRSGQILSEKAKKPRAAPRISHLVEWTRELRNAAPLVPASEHAGGTLIARTPDGDEAKLELRRYHVDVHIEDGFARTTIDQTYFNHTQDRLEGTFRFPLPPDASLSRLAMYVDGRLMEGGMAERDHARAAYERIVYEQRDPALLEWVDGSTFKLRVFPLEPRQEKRLLLSYTQRLPSLYGTLSYRFPAGHSLGQVKQWSFNARIKKGTDSGWHCESHPLAARKDGDDLVLQAMRKDARLDRDVVLRLDDPEMKEPGSVLRFATMEQDGAKYLLVRYRPDLPTAAEPQRRDWVVVMETSGDRDPLLMRTQIELLRALLGFSGRDDTFVILTASTRTRALQPRAVRNDPAAIDEAMSELEKIHLIGALDLGAALTAARPHLEAAKSPYLLHIGSGIAAMGSASTEELLKRIPKGTRYVGVGVGRRWNRSLMRAAAEATGGLFSQVNPDEVIDFRGLELATTLNTPRLVDVQFSDAAGKGTFLPFTRLVNQGEEMAAVCRVTGGELPKSVRVRARLDGTPFERELQMGEVREKAAYLPRSWAKLEIERLLAEDAAKHREKIVELSKAMYVLTPFTSLLVLENDDMYTQFKVDRGRKDHWAMYPAPARIKVVHEPIDGDPGDPKKGIKPAARVVRQSVLVRARPNVLARPSVEDVLSSIRKASTGSLMFGDGERLSVANTFQSREGRHLWKDNAKEEFNFFMGWTRDGEDRRERTTLKSLNDANALPPATRNVTIGTTVLDPTPLRIARASTVQADTMGGTAGETLVSGHSFANRSDLVTTNTNIDEALEAQVKGLITRRIVPELSMKEPTYTGDDRLYFDLLSYAPGLNTTTADISAVIETEARRDPHSWPGTIAAGARALIDKARKAGWRSFTRPEQAGATFTVRFDGTGRYTWQRTLASGLREQVVCDGDTLWHLYPQLGLAARRTVSRFHRLDFAAIVPWALPRAEDLARGADLVLLNPDTVALIPHATKDAEGKPARHRQLHLIFGKDGQLSERRLVEMPGKKLLARETYSAEGIVRHLDGDGKELSSLRGKLAEADEPALKPAVEKLVVVPMPYRTAAHVRATTKLVDTPVERLTFDQARLLLITAVANGDASTAQNIFRSALANREQRQLGYYVLLAAAGVNLDGDNLDVLDAHPHEQLAQYLALHSSPVLRKHASRWAAASNTFTDRFLRRLTLGHALCQRWASGKALGTSAAQRKTERSRALAFVKEEKGSDLAWALLSLVENRTAEEKDKKAAREAWKELADAYALFADTPGLGEMARYEQARCLWRAGQSAEARQLFVTLYRQSRKAGRLLHIDVDFRAALLDAEKDGWAELLRNTAAELIKQKKRAAILLLAQQCWLLDDQPMAQALLTQALAGVRVQGKDGLALHLSAVRWLMLTNQHASADRLLRSLLADTEHTRLPQLWRLAADLAEKRDQPGRRLECLEKALDLEYRQLPEVINLEQVRKDYRSLLEEYDRLARALQVLESPAPAGFRDRVVRAADRWRALDRQQQDACQLAAGVLRRLGERELAWDYLTTPVGLNPAEADVWVSLADTLKLQGERDLADRAYASAFERESTNADILWQRAENLRQIGRLTQAQTLYRQLAETDWQPRFRHLRTQAQWLLDRR